MSLMKMVTCLQGIIMFGFDRPDTDGVVTSLDSRGSKFCFQ